MTVREMLCFLAKVSGIFSNSPYAAGKLKCGCFVHMLIYSIWVYFFLLRFQKEVDRLKQNASKNQGKYYEFCLTFIGIDCMFSFACDIIVKHD